MVDRETPKRSATSFLGMRSVYGGEHFHSEVLRVGVHHGPIVVQVHYLRKLAVRACLVKVRARMLLHAFSYEKPYSTSPIPSGLVYDRLWEDGVEVESLDES
jgi:hypothetical protein